MRQTLRSRILFYFLIVSLCGIVLTSLSILWGFEDQFKEYLRENQEKNINVIEEDVIQEYKENGSLVSVQLESMLHKQAMTENLFYKIYDADGNLLVDTMSMHDMMSGQSETLLNNTYQSAMYDLVVNQNQIGRIQAFYPNRLLDEDFAFLKSMKQNIYIAAIVTLILSFLFSMLFSKRLASGFQKLSKAVHELQEHKAGVRVPVEELTDEMKPLGHSFNQLALSLSKEEVLRKQFTADLAHELRTPLATLRSQIEAYQDGIWEPTPKRLQQSHDELMRLVRLVNELEKLLAAENPQMRLQKIDLEAGKILVLMEGQFSPAFHEKGVNLNIIKPAEEYWFNADPDRIVQILTNIIHNALQYTPSGKNVTVEIVQKHQFVGFSVKDEGVGISKEDLPLLFERFYRGDKSRDRKTGGIGIGLSIVKALVDAHHGEIKIESQLHVGTTVTVFLPRR